jgi:hypothetical protein
MRKLAVVVASVLALAGTALAVPAAWAGHATETIVVIAKVTHFGWEAHGTEGPEGDKVAFGYDLFDTTLQKGGDGAGTCQLTKVESATHEATAACHAFFNIEGGKIEAEGEVTHGGVMGDTMVLTITGGTGDFGDAQGTVTVEPLLVSPAHPAGHGDQGMGGEGHGHHKLAKVTFEFT